MVEDAAFILLLAQHASLAAAAALVASAPAARVKSVARALGAAKATCHSRKRAGEWLVQQASWAMKYRAIYDRFQPAISTSVFAAATAATRRSHTRSGSSPRCSRSA